MPSPLRVIAGPPGTGKTTRQAEGVAAAARVVGAQNILITSLTKAAAAEIASRVDIPSGNVGTLHSMCLRLLERPALATSKEAVAEWNRHYPAWRLKPSGSTETNPDDPLGASGGNDEGGDKLLEDSSILRHLRRPKVLWPRRLLDFDKAWRSWKDTEGVIDFTDMIEQVVERRLPPPGTPRLLVVDEAQDLSPLENECIRLWSSHVETTVVTGDADQAIFSWRGSVPELFMPSAVADEDFEVLEQSYRVPAAVHARAMRVIGRCANRRQVTYRPTDVQGTVSVDGSFAAPGRLIERAVRHMKDPSLGRMMFIAPCAFTLQPVIRGLREQGLPYWNPYKLSHGAWNPLAARKGVTAASRVVGFTAMAREGRPWTGPEFQAWATGLEAAKVWKHGVKTQIEREDFVPPTSGPALQFMMRQPDQLPAILKADLDWYAEHAQASLKDRLAYPLAIARRWGVLALDDMPRITVGTIHCSPPDEPILTNEGYVPIGDLDPSRHRLAGYVRENNRLVWGGKGRSPLRTDRGFQFVSAKNPYQGDLVVMETDRSRTRVTPDHRVMVRYGDGFYGRWVVYLMRRGGWWRLGVCTSARRPYQSGGIPGRLATEQAEDGWIIRICQTREEAIFEEAMLQVRYGVPGLTFEASEQRSLSSKMLHTIHESCSSEVAPRALNLLLDHNLLVDAPLYRRRSDQRRNMAGYWFETEAANLFNGCMEIPTAPQGFIEKRVSNENYWRPTSSPVCVHKETYKGSVFSLDVTPHHRYISGGAVIHNSVKGGESEVVALSGDLSPKGVMTRDADPDVIRRLIYVGMTRTFRDLILTIPSQPKLSAAMW